MTGETSRGQDRMHLASEIDARETDPRDQNGARDCLP